MSRQGDHGKLARQLGDRAAKQKAVLTRAELRADVFDYIEKFYDRKRNHSNIG